MRKLSLIVGSLMWLFMTGDVTADIGYVAMLGQNSNQEIVNMAHTNMVLDKMGINTAGVTTTTPPFNGGTAVVVPPGFTKCKASFQVTYHLFNIFNGANGVRYAVVKVNGNDKWGMPGVTRSEGIKLPDGVAAGYRQRLNGTGVITDVSPGDLITLDVIQGSGADQQIEASNSYLYLEFFP